MRLRIAAVTVGVSALLLAAGSIAPAIAAPKNGGGSGAGGGKGCGKNACTTTSSDTTAPSISVSAPTDGSTVSGTVTIWGSASDDVALSKVEVAVDGGAWAPASGTTSWSRGLDTTAYGDGSHTLAARAVDSSGNTKSVSSTVTFSNAPAAPAPDTTAPSVSLSSPSNGATVDGVIAVTGSANDNVGVARVEIAVDGGAWASASGTASWSRSVDTSTWAGGSTHSIAARSIDTSGNVSSSTTVSVTKASAPATPPPAGDASIAPDTQGVWTSPEGLYIEVNTAGPFTIRRIYAMVLENAAGPGDFARIAPNVKVRVQDQYASQTTSTARMSNGMYTSFSATLWLKGVSSTFASQPDSQLSHEYGHVWTMHHLYMGQQGDWSTYLDYRWANADGSLRLADDSRLGSSYTWDKAEIIADDYRLLFGSSLAISQRPTHMNTSIPEPDEVPGLKSFLLNNWA